MVEIGRLKIFLGPSPGAGKTYSALQDAIATAQSNNSIAYSFIKEETFQATLGLASKTTQLAPKIFEFRGTTVKDFDLQNALQLKPDVLILDDLAHRNVQGCQHAKRWQDVADLLSQGINVWTTLNVYEIESFRDSVRQIPGLVAEEFVPDFFLQQAEEIQLVDVTFYELIRRQTNKLDIDPSSQSNLALKTNLFALRELGFRFMANRVSARLKQYSALNTSISGSTPAAGVLVGVSPSTISPRLVRVAAQLAASIQVPFTAVFIETARTRLLKDKHRVMLQQSLTLAEDLGGSTLTVNNDDIVSGLLVAASEKNSRIILVGKPIRTKLRDRLLGSVVDELVKRSEDLDVYLVRTSEEEGTDVPLIGPGTPTSFNGILLTLAILATSTALCFLMSPWFELSNLIMVYMLGVCLVAFRCGRNEAIFASILSVLCFDFFFIPPRFTLAVTNLQYLVTFAVMLVVSWIISSLVLRLRYQSKTTEEREGQTALLLQLSKTLGECRTKEEAAQSIRSMLAEELKVETVIFWPDKQNHLKPLNQSLPKFEQIETEKEVAKWVSARNLTAGIGTQTFGNALGIYLPLPYASNQVAVLAIFPPQRRITQADLAQIEGIRHLSSSALGRIEFEAEASVAQLRAEKEELRNILLSSISHDLRTPLTAISWSAHLLDTAAAENSVAKELAAGIQESASKLVMIVRNVLDLSKLQSGTLELKREWHSLEEIIGVSLQRCSKVLRPRKINVTVEPSYPMVWVDGLLIEQLVVNLLENAAKYTQENSTIDISVEQANGWHVLRVEDDGPGLDPTIGTALFDKMVRGKSSHGFGLGLAICKAIALAHGGEISALNREPKGTSFIIKLPIDFEPPEVIYDQ